MSVGTCGFEVLYSQNVPHILELIFLSLDYESYKICLQVNQTWKELLTSERCRSKWKYVFKEDMLLDETKLQIAARQNNTDEVRRLLSSGMVNINCMDCYQCTPLHEAAINGSTNASKLLLDNGAEPNVTDQFERTPLLDAVTAGHQEVAQILIESGAGLNVANKHGFTPLHGAILRNLDMVKFLVARGSICTLEHIRFAREHGAKDVVTFLTNFKVNINPLNETTKYGHKLYFIEIGHQIPNNFNLGRPQRSRPRTLGRSCCRFEPLSRSWK